jgi:hypothetical protein
MDLSNGVINIKGRSISHEASEYFVPFIHQFFLYAQSPLEHTEINIQIEMLNSESTRSLMNLFVVAEKIQRRGHEVQINWYYQNEDDITLTQGNVFESLLEIPFKYVKVN